MDPLEQRYLDLTRRRFFGRCASGAFGAMGSMALASLVGDGRAQAAPAASAAPRGVHFAPKAKRVIYMHMEGAPSQLDLWDYKPQLRRRYNEDLPDSIRQGQRLTGMTSGQSRFPVAPSMFRFSRYANNEDGAWISELMPHTGAIAKDLCFVHSMHTDAINHEPGITFFQTGSQQPGRPSFGAWASYGLGSASANLPAFVVLIAQGFGNMQALSARFWGSGFLPSEHQGCHLRSGGDPVLYLNDPPGLDRPDRRRMLDLVGALNEREMARSLDPEVQARISQYEMAYRMQMSVPELVDLSGEDEETLDMYGPEVRTPGTFASNCLRARRLAERGVRFIQLYMRGWDAHNNLPGEIRLQSAAVDQPQAALVKDLKRRGMLDDTLVIWAGEFGRTVYSQGALTETNYGRDHHPRCFTIWMAGGGIKPGVSIGRTDDYSYNIVENPVDVHDLHATLLHLLGLDHERLTYRTEGRDFRLTDVFGKVRPEMLAQPMADALLQLAGRLHPMLLHLPIGVLAALLLLESWGLVRRKPIERGVRLPMAWLLAAAAVMSVTTGIVLSDEPGYVGDTVDLHRWLGIVTGAMLLIAAGLATTGRVRGYAGALVVAAALIVPTGHLGASMTHGDDFLTAPFTAHGGLGPGGDEGTAGAAVGDVAPPPWYETRIAPILAAHCTACHGASRRKGGLALHTGADIHTGGSGGAVVTAEGAGPAPLVRRIRLPLTDDEHMPPEGKPQLSPAQIDALAVWVEAGAPIDDTPTPASTPDIEHAAAADPEPAASAPPAARSLPRERVADLRAAHVHVERIDPEGDLLWIDFTAAPNVPQDDMVRLLAPLAPFTAELSLRGVASANAVLVRCAPWEHLRHLDVTRSALEADGLAAATAGGGLAELTLVEAAVTDEAAAALAGIESLEQIHVWRSGVSDEVVARLRAARPALTVNDGSVQPPPPLEVEPEVALGAPPIAAALTPVNTACPVSGAPIDAKFSVVHEGKVVAFCCEVCAAKFWADPAAYPIASD